MANPELGSPAQKWHRGIACYFVFLM